MFMLCSLCSITSFVFSQPSVNAYAFVLACRARKLKKDGHRSKRMVIAQLQTWEQYAFEQRGTYPPKKEEAL